MDAHTATMDQQVVPKELTPIEKGFAFLDENIGKDWVDDINLTDLDMSNTGNCILGQLYGSFGLGTDVIQFARGISLDEACDVRAELGFDLTYETGHLFPFLTLKWHRAILARLAELHPTMGPPCPHCNGTGQVKGKDCSQCGGTGTATDWR